MNEPCPICGVPKKGMRNHIRISHPEEYQKRYKEGVMVEKDDTGKEGEGQPSSEEAMLQLIEPLIVKSVNKTLGDMKLTELIGNAVGTKVEKLGQDLSEEISQAVAVFQKQSGNNAAAEQSLHPAQDNQSQGPSLGGLDLNQIIGQFAASWAQRQLGGGGGGEAAGGLGGLTSMVKTMKTFQEAAATLYQEPRLTAQREMVDIFKMGMSIDMSPEQIITGVEKNLDKHGEQSIEHLARPTT